MKFHVMTLFPQMIEQAFAESITGRALSEGKLELTCHNIRSYSQRKHAKVDDYSYGGGAGMLLQAQPVYDCYQNIEAEIPSEHRRRVIYVTPQGRPFRQSMAREFAEADDLIFLCGHYEGIDERVLEEIVTDYVSIGDYILTGGELAALVMMDAVARLVDGVLGNEESSQNESFQGKLLEYPQYTRPESWHGKAVPDLLLSGDEARIERWRKEQSIARTRERRPDLFADYQRLAQVESLMAKEKREYLPVKEKMASGSLELVRRKKDAVLLCDEKSGDFYFINPKERENGDSAAFFEELYQLTAGSLGQKMGRLWIYDWQDQDALSEILDLNPKQTYACLVYCPKERPSNARIRTILQGVLSDGGRQKSPVIAELCHFIEVDIVQALSRRQTPYLLLELKQVEASGEANIAELPLQELADFGIYPSKRRLLLLDRDNP